MSFQPHWRRGDTGWYPVPARTKCLSCKGELHKLHGLNREREDRDGPTVMGLFLFGTGVWCLHCGTKAWCDPTFFERSGSNEYSSQHHDLEADFRPKFPSIEDELKKL